MRNQNLSELIASAQQGDSGATGQLYEMNYTSIYRYLYYRTGLVQVAEDLTAEVFLKMVQALPAYRQTNSSFRTWLFQIARNLAIDYYRRTATHGTEPLFDEEAIGQEGVDEMVDVQLTRQTLQDSLSGLGDIQRDVIVLRFVEGLSLQEVAEVLHRSEDAIKGLQRRGLLLMRQSLLQMEDRNDLSG